MARLHTSRVAAGAEARRRPLWRHRVLAAARFSHPAPSTLLAAALARNSGSLSCTPCPAEGSATAQQRCADAVPAGKRVHGPGGGRIAPVHARRHLPGIVPRPATGDATLRTSAGHSGHEGALLRVSCMPRGAAPGVAGCLPGAGWAAAGQPGSQPAPRLHTTALPPPSPGLRPHHPRGAGPRC